MVQNFTLGHYRQTSSVPVFGTLISADPMSNQVLIRAQVRQWGTVTKARLRTAKG